MVSFRFVLAPVAGVARPGRDLPPPERGSGGVRRGPADRISIRITSLAYGAVTPTPREEASPTGAMPVCRRRGGREWGFGGKAPEHLLLESGGTGRSPRHLGKKQAQPERCRSAGVAEGGSGGSGAKPPSICFLRAAARGGRPDTSGRSKPNRSDAGPPASRRAEWGFGGKAPEHLFLESGGTGRSPRHLWKKQAQPERCRSAGVAEGGVGVRGQSPRASVSREACAAEPAGNARGFTSGGGAALVVNCVCS